MSEVDDTLGDPKPRRGRPPGKARPNVDPAQIEALSDAAGGVSVAWLAKAFRMDLKTVRNKLVDCPPLEKKGTGYTYSLPVAASFLVRPRIDVASYIAALEPKDLPVQLQPTYWSAQLQRQKWEVEARQLWPTEDVVDVLAEVFKAIKFSVQLWPDTVEQMTSLSEEQRGILVKEADAMQDEVYRKMTEMVTLKATPSAIARLADVPGEEVEDQSESIL